MSEMQRTLSTKPPRCHPKRQNYAKRMCRACYQLKYPDRVYPPQVMDRRHG